MSEGHAIIVDAKALERLQDALRVYSLASKKTRSEIVANQGKNLARRIASKLRDLAPAKGSSRQSALDRMAAGGGVRVRKAIREKLANRLPSGRDRMGRRLTRSQAAVARELSTRESGRGSLGASSRFWERITSDASATTNNRTAAVKSRYGYKVSTSTQYATGAATGIRFDWAPFNRGAAQILAGINKPKAHKKIEAAVEDTTRNMLAYPRIRAEHLAQALAEKLR